MFGDYVHDIRRLAIRRLPDLPIHKRGTSLSSSLYGADIMRDVSPERFVVVTGSQGVYPRSPETKGCGCSSRKNAIAFSMIMHGLTGRRFECAEQRVFMSRSMTESPCVLSWNNVLCSLC